jgi:NADH:ubiquinone oxidoreductase subunit 5 (subunit L)/multisubunit Na+/H+ antiporter MnhA subunit
MPWTGALFVLGAVAICGLPPLGGFASEWLIYMGLLRGALATSPGAGLLLLFVVAALATVGVLAALCFVRLVGIAFLGQPRSPAAERAHESGPGLVGPMLALAAVLPVAGFGAPAVVGLLGRPVNQLVGASLGSEPAVLALRPVVSASAALVGLAAVVALALRLAVRRSRPDETWGCGYLAPTPHMQYTARSFAQIIAGRLLPSFFSARLSARRPSGLFPETGSLSSDASDPLTRSAFEPFFDRWARRLSRMRWMQQGILHGYLLYILVMLVAGLAWASARRWWWGT